MTETTDPQAERRNRYAAAMARRDGDTWPTAYENDEPDYLRRADAAIAVADAEQAELRARVADYENRITWETTCGSCARILDSSIRETERAEQAEAALARVRSVLESEAVVGRTALDYRGLILTALMADAASGPSRADGETQQDEVAPRQDPCAECGHPKAVHSEGEDPVSPGRCAACPESGEEWHDYQPVRAVRQDPTPDSEPVRHAPGIAVLCPGCRTKGHAICMNDGAGEA